MDPYMLQGIRKFSEKDYLNDDEVEAENNRVLSNIPVKTFGIARNAESGRNFHNTVTGGKRLPQSSIAAQHFSGKRLPALTISAKRLPHQPRPQHSSTFEAQIIPTHSSSLAVDKMPSNSQSSMSMGGLERISITHSKTHPRMPLPPASLLQTNPLKYLKTYLVLIRPARMRESEMDYSILESNPLITVSHLKQAIAWISPKLIAIMNENAELERQVKNLGPRRTKVLGADVYQPITQFKMRREEWRGTDFAYCLKEATRRLPKEEIKNTRFLARLQRNPLNGQAAKCAEQTTEELGLSLPDWINARCVASDGSRMDLFCEPVESTAIREHAVALTSEASSSSYFHALTTDIPTNTKRSRAKPKAGGAAAATVNNTNTNTNTNKTNNATSSRQNKGKNKKRSAVAANLDDEDHAGDSGDHTSDSDFAQQAPPRKKTKTKTSTPGKSSHATKKRAVTGGRRMTAAATSTSHSGSGSAAYAHHHARRRQQSGSYNDDVEHQEEEDGDGYGDENEGDVGGRVSRGARAATPTTTRQQQHNQHRSSNANVCPSTPAGKMIQVKDEIYSS